MNNNMMQSPITLYRGKYMQLQQVFWFSILCVAFAACNNKDARQAYRPTFAADTASQNSVFIGFPSFSYSETAEPLLKYIKAQLPDREIKMKACISFDDYLNDLNQHKYDITLING